MYGRKWKSGTAMRVFEKCMEGLLNIFLRSILGTIAIFLINGGLAALGLTLSVGINLVTFAVVGILGFPGLLALYSLGIYRML